MDKQNNRQIKEHTKSSLKYFAKNDLGEAIYHIMISAQQCFNHLDKHEAIKKDIFVKINTVSAQNTNKIIAVAITLCYQTLFYIDNNKKLEATNCIFELLSLFNLKQEEVIAAICNSNEINEIKAFVKENEKKIMETFKK